MPRPTGQFRIAASGEHLDTIPSYTIRFSTMKLSLLAISLVWGVALGSEVAVGSVGVNSVSEKSSRASQQNTEAYNGIKRAIASAMVSKREFVQDNSTVLDKSWVDAVLLTFPQFVFPSPPGFVVVELTGMCSLPLVRLK